MCDGRLADSTHRQMTKSEPVPQKRTPAKKNTKSQSLKKSGKDAPPRPLETVSLSILLNEVEKKSETLERKSTAPLVHTEHTYVLKLD